MTLYQPPMSEMMTKERSASMALVDGQPVTNEFLPTQGTWGNPANWSRGVVPDLTDNIHIAFGKWCDVDAVYPPFWGGCVDGTLNFLPDRNTGLSSIFLCSCTSDDLVTEVGQIFIGTETAPIEPQFTATFTIADRGVRDAAQQKFDPKDFTGSLMSHGVFRAFGAKKVPYAYPTVNVVVNSSTVTFSMVPQGWNVGDSLVFPPTLFSVKNNIPPVSNTGHDEVRQIVSMTATTVTLNAPLEFDHSGVPVGNLTRNVVITSAVVNDITRRGHFMQMHRQDLQVDSVLFKDLGRTNALVMHTLPQLDASGVLIPGTDSNTIGRYGGVHCHVRGGGFDAQGNGGPTFDYAPMTVNNCVVWGSPKHGMVNHGAYAIFTNNISYLCNGAGFFGENSSEIGACRNNLAIVCIGSQDPGGIDNRRGIPPVPDDNGHNGFGYWLTPGIEDTDNIAIGCWKPMFSWPNPQASDMSPSADENGGFMSWLLAVNLNLPSGFERPNMGDSTLVWPMDSRKIQIRSLGTYHARNVYIACNEGVGAYQVQGGGPSIFNGTNLFHCGTAYEFSYTQRIQISDNILRGADVTVDHYPGPGHAIAGNVVFQKMALLNSKIEGFEVGLAVPVMGGIYVSGCEFNNISDIEIYPAGNITSTNPFLVQIVNCTFGDLGKPINYPKKGKITFYKSYQDNGLDNINDIFAPQRSQLDGQDIVADYQMPDYIPFPVSGTPNFLLNSSNFNHAWLGLTNTQIFAMSNVWVGGYQIAEQQLVLDSRITGGGFGVFGPIISGTAPPVMTPVAMFSAAPVMGTTPLTVHFTDQSTNMPTSWMWNFGDGNMSMMQNPSHQYTVAGTYTVTLSATNSAGTGMVTKTGLVMVGVPMTTVPNVVGMTYSQAVQTIQAANLMIGPDNTKVASQNPVAGTSVPLQTVVQVD